MALHQRRRQLSPKLIKRLVWWAEVEFRKLKPLREGGTLGDAFAQFRREMGRPHPAEAEQIRAPEAALYLYEWFWEIAQGRPLGPEGMQMALPNAEILAWCQLKGVHLVDWEVTAIRALDGTYLRIAAEKEG